MSSPSSIVDDFISPAIWRLKIVVRHCILVALSLDTDIKQGPLHFPEELCSFNRRKVNIAMEAVAIKETERLIGDSDDNDGLSKRLTTSKRSELHYLPGSSLVYQGYDVCKNFEFPLYMLFPNVMKPSFRKSSLAAAVSSPYYDPVGTLYFHLDASSPVVLPLLPHGACDRVSINVYGTPSDATSVLIQKWAESTRLTGIPCTVTFHSISLLHGVIGQEGYAEIPDKPYYREELPGLARLFARPSLGAMQRIMA